MRSGYLSSWSMGDEPLASRPSRAISMAFQGIFSLSIKLPSQLRIVTVPDVACGGRDQGSWG